MVKVFLFGFIIFSFSVLFSCNSSKDATAKNQFVTLKNDDKLAMYLKNYFTLSENRAIETWYKIYLSKCTTFYKIEKPTKDTILNLIKSYWLTSDGQNHDITKIEAKNITDGKEVMVTMNYSYKIIATNTKKLITNLKLLMILDKKRNVVLVREYSRD